VSTSHRATRIWRGFLSLVVLAGLAFTLHAVAFSGAAFTAGSNNPVNVFVAGSLSHANDQDGRLMIRASALLPGTSTAGTMTLTATGSLGGVYRLTSAGLVNTPATPRLSDAVTLTVEDTTGAPRTLYTGSVSAFIAVSLGTIAPGAARTYRLTLAYPAGSIDASLQGAALTLSLLVTGVLQ
jgi:hypothetical protein